MPVSNNGDRDPTPKGNGLAAITAVTQLQLLDRCQAAVDAAATLKDAIKVALIAQEEKMRLLSQVDNSAAKAAKDAIDAATTAAKLARKTLASRAITDVNPTPNAKPSS